MDVVNLFLLFVSFQQRVLEGDNDDMRIESVTSSSNSDKSQGGKTFVIETSTDSE